MLQLCFDQWKTLLQLCLDIAGIYAEGDKSLFAKPDRSERCNPILRSRSQWGPQH